MNQSLAAKWFGVTDPVAIVDNNSWTTNEIDTIGFDYCEIYVRFGAMDIAMVALKVQESDTTGTSFGDVTGLVCGTSTTIAGTASTLPSATADNTGVLFQIDLRGRKRFLDLVATGGDGSTGTYMVATARLSRCEDLPVTAAHFGAAQVLRV